MLEQRTQQQRTTGQQVNDKSARYMHLQAMPLAFQDLRGGPPPPSPGDEKQVRMCSLLPHPCVSIVLGATAQPLFEVNQFKRSWSSTACMQPCC